MERKTRSALVSGSLPPVCEATPSQPREVQQKSAGFGSFWKQPLYKCDSPMKMVRAEGAIGWINSGDLLCARNGSGGADVRTSLERTFVSQLTNSEISDC